MLDPGRQFEFVWWPPACLMACFSLSDKLLDVCVSMHTSMAFPTTQRFRLVDRITTMVPYLVNFIDI
jgi:hypothetical protein